MTAMPWFRLYHRTIDDDKLRLLAFEDRWHFIALCCLKAEGLLDEPPSDIRTRRIAVKLGVQLRELDEIGRRLRDVELVDDALIPCAWDELQHRSDNSAARVKRYRENRKAKGLQAQWQPTKDLRQAIYERDNFACVYCAATDDLTIDHKTPEMHGGDHSLNNLQTACRRCNAQKRDLTHEEYVKKQDIGKSVTKCNGYSNGAEGDREGDIELSPNGDCASDDAPALKPEHVMESWNALASRLGKPRILKLTPSRRAAVKARIAGYSIDEWQRVLSAVERSAFLRGEGKWKGCTFDWITKANNFQKILEGNYDD